MKMVGMQRRVDLVMEMALAMFGCSRLDRTRSAYKPSWVIMLGLSKSLVEDYDIWWFDEKNE